MKLSFTGFNVALVLLLVPGIARADNPDLNAIIGTAKGDTPAFITNYGNDWFGNASTYNLSTSSSFAVDYGNAGYITGRGYCSTRAGNESAWDWDNNAYALLPENVVENLTDETGQTGARYCYCKLDKYVPSGASTQSLTGPWVYTMDLDQNGATGNCTYSCYEECMSNFAYTVPDSPDRLSYRTAMFNAYAPGTSGGASGTSSVVATQTYVDNLLNTKQAKITTTGTNKLMTYGSSAGNIGERNIVTTLGDDTTATTAITTGAVNTGLNNKQPRVNGTNGYIMAGTGTAGTVAKKPVYGSTTQYTNALVEAQTVNTAATAAANSELTCIDNDCLLLQIRTTAPTGITLTGIYLDTSINGTDTCYRAISTTSSYNRDGTCSATTLGYLGTSGNKSGKWGVVFPYGDVTGISVCSSLAKSGSGTYPVATSEQIATLENEFSSQTGQYGSLGSDKKYCYCKIVGPAASQWVFREALSSSSLCGNSCANHCAGAVSKDLTTNAGDAYRIAIYGTM